MKRKELWIGVAVFAVLLVAGVIDELLAEDPVEVEPVEEIVEVVATPEPEPVIEVIEEVEGQTDAERLGVTERELSEIEHVMKVAGWEYTREDFERIYRLKDAEMTLNPAVFAQYEVTVRDGQTHDVMLNLSLVED